MKTFFVFLLFSASTSFAALPPHYEQARILSYVARTGADLFPFDPIMSISDLGKHQFKLISASGCAAEVEVVFGELPREHVGPLPFKELTTISNNCKK